QIHQPDGGILPPRWNPGGGLQHDGQLVNPASDLVGVDRGESQLQSFTRGIAAQATAETIAAEGNDFDLPRGGGLGRGFSIDPVAQPADGLQASLYRGDLQQSIEPLPRFIEEDAESLGVDLTHSTQMAPEMAFGDEVAEHDLIEQMRMSTHHGPC